MQDSYDWKNHTADLPELMAALAIYAALLAGMIGFGLLVH